MFLRIKRETLDSMPDSILSAASSIGAPMVQQTTGDHLTVVSVSGSQLTALQDKLNQFAREYPSLGRREEVVELLEELYKCSRLYIVSTSIELILVSNRAGEQYEIIYDLTTNLMPSYEDFRDECRLFIGGLANLGLDGRGAEE